MQSNKLKILEKNKYQTKEAGKKMKNPFSLNGLTTWVGAHLNSMLNVLSDWKIVYEIDSDHELLSKEQSKKTVC